MCQCEGTLQPAVRQSCHGCCIYFNEYSYFHILLGTCVVYDGSLAPTTIYFPTYSSCHVPQAAMAGVRRTDMVHERLAQRARGTAQHRRSRLAVVVEPQHHHQHERSHCTVCGGRAPPQALQQ